MPIISPHTLDAPFVPAARVSLAQHEPLAEVKLYDHPLPHPVEFSVDRIAQTHRLGSRRISEIRALRCVDHAA